MNYMLLGSYLVTSAAIIATPGPNTLLMVQHAMQFGQRVVVFNALGSALASLILISISVFGLTAFLEEGVLKIFSLLGSIYLIYIGLCAILTRDQSTSFENNLKPTNKKDLLKCFYSSFFTGISNPKDIIFFIIFLPQFIDNNTTGINSQLSLIIAWLILDIIIMCSYGIFSSFIRKLNQNRIIIFKKISGLIIFIIGACLLLNSTKEAIFQ